MIRIAVAGYIGVAALPMASRTLHGQDAVHKKPDVHFVVTRRPVVEAMLEHLGPPIRRAGGRDRARHPTDREGPVGPERRHAPDRRRAGYERRLRLRLVGRGAAFEFKGRVRGDAVDGTVKRNGEATPWTARRARLAYGG